jgi:hypothetical protein
MVNVRIHTWTRFSQFCVGAFIVVRHRSLGIGFLNALENEPTVTYLAMVSPLQDRNPADQRMRGGSELSTKKNESRKEEANG